MVLNSAEIAKNVGKGVRPPDNDLSYGGVAPYGPCNNRLDNFSAVQDQLCLPPYTIIDTVSYCAFGNVWENGEVGKWQGTRNANRQHVSMQAIIHEVFCRSPAEWRVCAPATLSNSA